MHSHKLQVERAQTPNDIKARLRILATTDLHMNLCGFDYYSDRSSPSVGLTRIACLIQKAREEADTMSAICLLLDNGDGLQGTPMGDLAITLGTRPHPFMTALDTLKYDAIGLGNHDFNFGLDTLGHILGDAPCPVVASNLELLASAPHLPTRRYAIFERTLTYSDGASHPIRIGVLSVLPPQTRQWDAHLIADKVAIHDMLAIAHQVSDELRDAGCDIVIALAHSGLGADQPADGAENIVTALSRSGTVDAVIGGHTHLPFCSSGQPHGSGTPTVLPGVAGSHLGVIDLELRWSHDTGWCVDQSHAELRAVLRRAEHGELAYVTPQEPKLTQALETPHTATRARMQEPVGHTGDSLHSYFTFCAPDRAMALVAAAQAAAVRGALMGLPEAELPLLSAVAPGKFGGRAGPDNFTDIPPGPVRLRNVADLHVYPNQLKAVAVSGRTVIDWLEMSAGVFNQVKPDSVATDTQPVALVNDLRAGHNFDVLHGLTYRIDLSQPSRFATDGRLVASSARRIRDIEWNGSPILPDQQFVVATNSYRMVGGGGFPITGGMRVLPLPSLPLPDVIRDHIATGSLLPSQATQTNVWEFAPLGGARVRLLTGPGARNYLSELSEQNLVVDGITRDGFLSLTLTL